MFRKTLLLALAISLLHVGASSVLAGSQGQDTRRIAKVKAQVAKRGTGEKARITVKLRDKKEVKGYVSQAGEDDFVVADAKTGAKTTIAYRDIAQVKGKGFPLAAKIGIGVGIGLVVLAIVVVHAFKNIGY
jgi:hypothetical protein